MLRKLLSVFGLVDIYGLSEKIRAKQVQLLYEQISVFVIISECVGATALCIALWNLKNHTLLIGWIIFVYLGGLSRQIINTFYFNNTDKLSNTIWIRLFGVGVFFSGMGWGCIGLFLMPTEGVIYQTALVIVILAVVSGANNILSPVLAIYTIYLLLSFVPMLVWFFLQGGFYDLLGVMSCCYLIVMLSSAFYTNKLVITSLILSLKNLDLALTEKQLNDELIVASRLAGMADIATSVLHNVGNVLTSANASASMISNKIATTKISNLEEISLLLQEHQNEIGAFLTSDPRGQLVPKYLTKLSQLWIDDKKYLLKELDSLNSSIQHIKEVISNQNKLGMSLGVMQEVMVTDVIEDALRLNQLICEQSQISIIREFVSTKLIKVDRVKLLQILVNLIKNGIESIIEAKNTTKQLMLRVHEPDDFILAIEIEDDGVGISPQDLQRIFHQRFTSKKTGHGFGLHSCILAAQEMNGTITVNSDGIGKGAKFIIQLPFK